MIAAAAPSELSNRLFVPSCVPYVSSNRLIDEVATTPEITNRMSPINPTMAKKRAHLAASDKLVLETESIESEKSDEFSSIKDFD